MAIEWCINCDCNMGRPCVCSKDCPHHPKMPQPAEPELNLLEEPKERWFDEIATRGQILQIACIIILIVTSMLGLLSTAYTRGYTDGSRDAAEIFDQPTAVPWTP